MHRVRGTFACVTSPPGDPLGSAQTLGSLLGKSLRIDPDAPA
jgi:hypothetical protein